MRQAELEQSNRKSDIRWTPELLQETLEKHRNGERQCDIARRFNISQERARQVICKAIRLEREKLKVHLLDGLSSRTKNLLLQNRIRNKDAARFAIYTGALEGVPNFGEKTKDEVLRWIEQN